MKIKKDLISKDRYNIKAPYKMKPEFLIVHNTANDASAKNEIAYMKRNNNQVSFHIAVDDKEAIQAIPFNRNSWNAGDGKNGRGNRNGIAIEICYSKSSGSKFDKAERNAAKVVAQLLKKYGWEIDKVKKHQDFDGKNCPHRTLSRGWDRFLDMIRKELGEKVKPSKPTTNKIPEDGWFGPATARKAQKVYGLKIVDGIVSGQPKNSSTRNIPAAKYGSSGSNLILAMQKEFGVPKRLQDRKITNPSRLVLEMQKYYGTLQDSKISGPSMVIKEWQKALNKGKRK